MAKCDFLLCCFRGKLTWPIVIAWFHITMYLTVILFNGYNLVEAISDVMSITMDNEAIDMTDNYEEYHHSNHLGLELMIAHSISIIILAMVGLIISGNLLRVSKSELAHSLKIWLVYTVIFCILTVPYYVWRLTVSENLTQNIFENVGRWLIQLVITNAFEGYFLGVAYSLITEMNTSNEGTITFGDSSKFRGLQSRDSQITFVADMTNLKSFSEMRI